MCLLRRDVASLAILLVVSWLSLSAACAAEASANHTESVNIVAVFAKDKVPYGEALGVRILVTHGQYSFPEVRIFYMPIIDNRAVGTSWRISPAQMLQAYLNETLYIAAVPNSVYGEALPSGTVIVYYVEARDSSGSALTSRQEDRWDPSVVDDKFLVQLVDVRPPSVSQVTVVPDPPVTGQTVTVLANVTDGLLGSGVRSVTLSYSVHNGPFTKVEMTCPDNEACAASIPALRHDQKLTFSVTALDNAGNKATSNETTYVVQKNVEEIGAEQQITNIVGLAVVIGVLAVLAVFWKRRTFTALSLALIVVFLVAARVAFVLWSLHGLWWWDAIILIGLVEFWALVDPRIQGTARPLIRATLEFGGSLTAYLSKTFRENPPTIFVAAAYVLGLGGAISDIILYLITRDIGYAYVLANFIAEYVFILLALGVLGQLILLWRKERGQTEQPIANA
jgi:hypothetical protein